MIDISRIFTAFVAHFFLLPYPLSYSLKSKAKWCKKWLKCCRKIKTSSKRRRFPRSKKNSEKRLKRNDRSKGSLSSLMKGSGTRSNYTTWLYSSLLMFMIVGNLNWWRTWQTSSRQRKHTSFSYKYHFFCRSKPSVFWLPARHNAKTKQAL